MNLAQAINCGLIAAGRPLVPSDPVSAKPARIAELERRVRAQALRLEHADDAAERKALAIARAEERKLLVVPVARKPARFVPDPGQVRPTADREARSRRSAAAKASVPWRGRSEPLPGTQGAQLIAAIRTAGVRLSGAELSSATGLPANTVHALLSQIAKRLIIDRTGKCGSYRFGLPGMS